MKTAEEWWASWPFSTQDDYSVEPVTLAKAAYEAALKEAASVAREQAKRYTCRTRRGICFAIADLIEKGA